MNFVWLAFTCSGLFKGCQRPLLSKQFKNFGQHASRGFELIQFCSHIYGRNHKNMKTLMASDLALSVVRCVPLSLTPSPVENIGIIYIIIYAYPRTNWFTTLDAHEVDAMGFFARNKTWAVGETIGDSKAKGNRGRVRSLFTRRSKKKKSRRAHNGGDEKHAASEHQAALHHNGQKHVEGRQQSEPISDSRTNSFDPSDPDIFGATKEKSKPQLQTNESDSQTASCTALETLLQISDSLCSSMTKLQQTTLQESVNCSALSDEITSSFSFCKEVPKEIKVNTKPASPNLNQPYRVLERMQEQKMRSFSSSQNDETSLPRMRVYVDQPMLDEGSIYSALTCQTISETPETNRI